MNNSTIDAFIDITRTSSFSVIDEVDHVMQLAIYVVICGFIGFFGIWANIVIVSVFAYQGFKDSINISLTGLAVSDLSASVAMVWISITYNPMLLKLNLSINLMDVMYVTGGWPQVCFNRITSFITAFITLERCICIAMPLKVKNIITPFRTKVSICFIFLSMFALFSPAFFVNKLEWVYNASQNRTIYCLAFTDNREIVDTVTFFIHSVVLSLVFLISVAICTTILVIKLNKKTKWRNATVMLPAHKALTATIKDKKVVKMITLIAAIFIVSYIPPTINFLVMLFNPEFSITGKLRNVFFICWSVAYVLEAVNSSVNIFVYSFMCSKFKVTFNEIFCDFSNKK